MLWVHATLVESVVLAYDAIVAPLDTRERDRYCEESIWVPIALGARDADVPRTWADMMRYVESVHASGALFVGDMARELASAVLSPPFGFLGGPLTWANRLITRGLLPPPIRAAYGFCLVVARRSAPRECHSHARRAAPLVAARDRPLARSPSDRRRGHDLTPARPGLRVYRTGR